MKPIALIALFCVAAVYAGIVAKDIDVLLKRAEELEAMSEKIINEFHNQSKSHLLSALEFEVRRLQTLAQHMRKLENQTEDRNVIIDKMEEDLLHAENRINEEIDFVIAVFNYNGTKRSANELINFGNGLIEKAREVLHLHETHNHREIETLRYEIHKIQDVLEHIQHHHHHHDDDDDDDHQSLQELERILVRHEMTLLALIQRIEMHH